MKRKKIQFSPPDLSTIEIENVVEVLKSGWITTGPKTKEFEQKISEYCNTKRTNCLNSATACMEMCLRLLEIGPGDEVITSAYTYTASASVIEHVGAKIVLVDTENDSFHLSYEKLEKAITEKTKAIIAVDIAGVMCDYDQIFSIVEKKKEIFKPANKLQDFFGRIVVLADAAHSLGAKYKGRISGSVADFTSFSFHAVKNLTTGEGGALTWRSLGDDLDEQLYNKVNILSLHGQTKDALSKNQLGSWEYDVISTAFKCNMTDIQASIGLGQFKRINELLERRKEIVEMYDMGLNDRLLKLKHEEKNYSSSRHLYMIRIKNATEIQRNRLIIKLAKEGISSNVHYKPLPLLTAYKNLGLKISDFPMSLAQYQNEITLPLHTKLTNEDVAYIIERVNYLTEKTDDI